MRRNEAFTPYTPTPLPVILTYLKDSRGSTVHIRMHLEIRWARSMLTVPNQSQNTTTPSPSPKLIHPWGQEARRRSLFRATPKTTRTTPTSPVAIRARAQGANPDSSVTGAGVSIVGGLGSPASEESEELTSIAFEDWRLESSEESGGSTTASVARFADSGVSTVTMASLSASGRI